MSWYEADQLDGNWFANMDNPQDNPQPPTIVPEDWDDFVKFIGQHREEIAGGGFDFRIERDWASSLTDEDLLLLVQHCPSSRLTIASAARSLSVLEVLSLDESAAVREAVADNVRTSSEILHTLSADSVSAVRMAVAENNNVTVEDLESLSTDSVNFVRWGVAHNEKTPSEVLEPLVKDPDGYVRDEAKRNPNAAKRGFWSRMLGKS
ncbi:MAG: hypothetical protein AABO41_11495 [Acidobacteriota bacterium]